MSSAQAGDLIVYRSAETRKVLHTGLVSARSPQGMALVESKWGRMGRFLHLPEDQTYSCFWQFYRSPRKGHLLEGLRTRTAR